MSVELSVGASAHPLPMVEKDTVSIHFVRSAVARLAPPVREHVLQAAHIAPEQLALAHARVTSAAFAALWLAIAHATDDEFFGLDRRRMKVGSFALLSRAVLHCRDLGHALRVLLRGFRALLDDIAATVQVQDGLATIVLANRIEGDAERRFADETFLVLVHGLMCWLVGQRLHLRGARFTGARPDHADEYAVMYTEHLVFDAQATALQFDAALLAAPLVQNEDTLRAFLRDAPQSVFLRYRNTRGWAARVRRRLRASLTGTPWPGLEDMAAEFNVSPTTLRRKLDAEGTSFQSIKDRFRRDTAIYYLGHCALSVGDMAAVLGFQDVSSFRRAFLLWTGVQPSRYRQRAPGLADARAGAQHAG